jgi:O-antigen/teichoic acid export membrane protein
LENQVTIDEKQTLKKNNTSFKGDVFRLVGGTVIAQIIGIITVPIISRFFGPEAYGTAALFTSITGVISVICCWRYELAIVVPEKDEEAASVFFVSLFASLITTILTFLLTAFWAEPLFKLIKSDNLLPFKWFIPFFIFIQGCYMTFNYWNSRTKRFSRVALAGVLNSTITRVINIITGSFGKASGGAMIEAYTAGQAVATSTIGLQILKQDSSFLKANFSFSDQFKILKKYKKFPLLGIWCAFLNTFSSDLPPLLLTYFFNSIVVGFFAFGHRLLSLPMALIGKSIAQVFFQRSAEAKHSNQLGNLTEKIFNQLFTLGLFPFMLLMIIAPELFSIAFGDKWYEAGVYSQILAPWVFCNFICAPITSIVDTLNKQEIAVYFNIVLVITRFLSLYIGGQQNNILLALTIYSVSGMLVYVLWSYVMLRLAQSNIELILKTFIKHFITTLVLLSPIIILKFYFNINHWALIIISLIFSFVYLYQLSKLQPEILNKIINKFKHRERELANDK